MADTIKTLHPQGKQGTPINRVKYAAVRAAILDVLREYDELTFREPGERVGARLRLIGGSDPGPEP